MLKCLRLTVSLLLLLTLGHSMLAQESGNRLNTSNPLIQLLRAKGILSPEEAASVLDSSSDESANQRLAKLLLDKGLISQQEYENTIPAASPRTPLFPAAPKMVPRSCAHRPSSPALLRMRPRHRQNLRRRNSFLP